jgi:hypothetical protein
MNLTQNAMNSECHANNNYSNSMYHHHLRIWKKLYEPWIWKNVWTIWISKSMKSVNNEHANKCIWLNPSKAPKKYLNVYIITLCQVWIYKCNELMDSSIGSPKSSKPKSHSFMCCICCPNEVQTWNQSQNSLLLSNFEDAKWGTNLKSITKFITIEQFWRCLKTCPDVVLTLLRTSDGCQPWMDCSYYLCLGNSTLKHFIPKNCHHQKHWVAPLCYFE